MRFSTLDQWLDWQQNLHWQSIELGLERIKRVASNLNLTSIAAHTIIVAGTNGKGSTVTYYAEFLRASGYKVGCYTSPHLMRYNERISINGVDACDQDIMAAFEIIDKARGDISLSYFEFGTLAALLCIKKAQVDVAVLEVGLGGRLDAVNIIDADLIHFTPIGLDHTAWLGETREKIAFEKAGVLRQGCQVICNDIDPPKSLLDEINKQSQDALFIGKDYHYEEDTHAFSDGKISFDLSSLSLKGLHQKLNCSGVIAGLNLLYNGQLFDKGSVQNCLSAIKFRGRFETIVENACCKTIIDVGHNVEAAEVLTQQLKQNALNKCVMILGMLDDKNVTDFCEQLSSVIDHCICIPLSGDRALSAEALSAKIESQSMTKEIALDMSDAKNKAELYLNRNINKQANSDAQDLILITGSFHTVEAYLSL